jgi:hypothetical protein
MGLRGISDWTLGFSSIMKFLDVPGIPSVSSPGFPERTLTLHSGRVKRRR